MFIFYIYIL